MKEGLNLLPSAAKFQAAKIKLKKKINLAMIVSLGIWVLFGIVVFGWWGFSRHSLNKTRIEKNKSLDKYKTFVDTVVLLRKNKYQSVLVGNVLKERFEYGESIKKVQNLFPDIYDFQIKTRKNFVISGTLKKGTDLLMVEEKVRDINVGLVSGFSSAKINSVDVDSGIWLFELEVILL